jgi:hypothetical protein
MSYNLSSATNNSAALQNALNSISNISNASVGNVPFITNNTSTNASYSFPSSLSPVFKMEFYKSENGGFVLNLIKPNVDTYSEKAKLFTLKDVENIGRDIQNILLVEILKQ